MPPPAIRIRIGAQIDQSSVDKAFSGVERRSEKAQDRLRKSSQKGSRDQAKAAEDAAKAQIAGQERVAKAGKKSADEWAKALRQIGKVAEQELNRQARAAASSQRRAGESFARRTSHRTTRFLTPEAPIGSIAGRAARDIARGVGVDFNFGNSLMRNRDLETQAIGLAQQERIATGGKTQGAGRYKEIARTAGRDLRVDPTQALSMARAFTGRTGEFAMIEPLLKRFGPLAVASGTDFEDLGSAAGFFFNQVKHLPDALARTEEGMRAIIGQTAVGAVEMPDFAKEMGRVAANANKFAGDRGENIKKLAALAQLSIASGGATSAADAARSVAAFGNTFGKGARINAFKKAGVELFEDPGEGPGKNTVMRDMFKIILDSFRQTQGNVPLIGNMFADTLGRKPINALGQAYQGAGGGEAGIKAVEAELDKYMKTTLSASAEQQNLKDHLESTAAKAQVFQNRLDEIAEKVSIKLLPALEEIGPELLKTAEALGSFTTWVIENPKTAIGAAITASIARAGIESAMRAGIERAILGSDGGRAGKVGRVAGALGAVGTGAAVAVTTLTVGTMIIDHLFNKAQEEQRKRVEANVGAFGAETEVRKKFAAGDAEGAKKLLEETIAKREANAAAMKEDMSSFWRTLGDNTLGLFDKDAMAARDASEKRALEIQQRELAASRELLQTIANHLAGGITITSLPTQTSGRVDQG